MSIGTFYYDVRIIIIICNSTYVYGQIHETSVVRLLIFPTRLCGISVIIALSGLFVSHNI